ncbi:hypothetical protein FOA52_003473 [Chlamydomonas sp. UWO 241]|nr:hypothetical protein FOA52_003473 [Chlamydomonas sp. UWO 241]
MQAAGRRMVQAVGRLRPVPMRQASTLGANPQRFSLPAHLGLLAYARPTTELLATLRPLHTAYIGRHARLDALVPCAKRRASGGARKEDGDAPVSVDAGSSELQRLREQVDHNDKLYHSDGKPAMSDAEYDALKARLREAEAAAGTAQAPPPMAGAPPTSALPKARHLLPMLSLASVHAAEDARTWHRKLLVKLQKLPGGAPAAMGPDGAGLDWVVEPKIDGLAVSLIYRDGVLARAATRGDGSVGEDVTHNAAVISGLPQTLTLGKGEAPSLLEVRGEVFMTRADLAMVNKAQAAAGGEPFANTRNAAAGSIRLQDPAICKSRHLSFLAYQVLEVPDDGTIAASAASSAAGRARSGAPWRAAVASQWRALEWLRSAGFTVSGDSRCVDGQGFNAALAAGEAWMATRGALAYDVDGVVIKLDDTSLQAALGTVGVDPCWAVALKFPAQATLTRLLGIDLVVGRTGLLVPVARLEPVSLGGVTVASATLHNAGYVTSHDLRVGDTVLVQRAGDVIPQVVHSLPDLRSGSEVQWQPPTQCPCCGDRLVLETTGPRSQKAGASGVGAGASIPSGATLWCRNADCSARTSRQALHFAMACLGGANMGPAVVKALMDADFVRDAGDFFEVTEAQLLQLPRFGGKRTETVLRGIEAAKAMPLAMLLTGLGISHVGVRTAKDLAAAFETAEGLQGATLEEVQAVPGIGGVTAASVVAWFTEPDNRLLLQKLRRAGVACVREPPQAPAPPADAAVGDGGGDGDAGRERQKRGSGSGMGLTGLEGLSVVVTGTLAQKGLSRGQFKALVEEFGGSLSKTINRRTGLVVAGERAGANKLSKAVEFDVTVVTEEEFWSKYGME